MDLQVGGLSSLSQLKRATSVNDCAGEGQQQLQTTDSSFLHSGIHHMNDPQQSCNNINLVLGPSWVLVTRTGTDRLSFGCMEMLAFALTSVAIWVNLEIICIVACLPVVAD
jgi:hypothetical protein